MESAAGFVFGISRPLKFVGFGVAAVFVISLFVWGLFSGGLAGFLIGLAIFFGAYQTVILFSAKSAALVSKEVLFWNGKGKLIAWDPTEGVLFLKNKNIDFVDDDPDDGGGMRSIFSLLGEELALRVPLEIQTTVFQDQDILTKEFVPVSITGSMYWRIKDITKFYLLISKEIRYVDDSLNKSSSRQTLHPQLGSAEQWLRQMAEEKTRALVSNIGTGLIISDRLAQDLREIGSDLSGVGGPESSSDYRSTTETLAAKIQREFQERAEQYGLEIHRVALQDVKLDPQIYQAAVEACKAAYLPLKAKAEAMARKLQLEAEASVLGADSVALKEISGNIPALAMQEFLSPIFMQYQNRTLPRPSPPPGN